MSLNEFSYSRIFALDTGKSDFAEDSLAFNEHPENKQALISAAFHSSSTKFLIFKAQSFFDWHPAPCRQFIFVLRGVLEVEVSDGEKRMFKPGDFLLVEDTTGSGHITRILGNNDALIAVSPISS